ncbi:hypothetical protein PDK10_04380 [Bacillus cereus]|uniref:hypothetical protein n=1 Tax=Bacillus sp. HSTU-bmb18 TaxID=2755318 RepID=UPI0034C5D2FC|nr:hypothetical protein [Bacillus cereus]
MFCVITTFIAFEDDRSDCGEVWGSGEEVEKEKEFVGDSRKTFENISKRNKKFAESYLIDLLTGNSLEKRRRKNFGEGTGGAIKSTSLPILHYQRIEYSLT